MSGNIKDYYKCITEYDEERTRAELRAEGFADGITDVRLQSLAKGEEKGTLAVLTSLVKKGIITLEQASEEAQMTVAEFEAKTNSMT